MYDSVQAECSLPRGWGQLTPGVDPSPCRAGAKGLRPEVRRLLSITSIDVGRASQGKGSSRPCSLSLGGDGDLKMP